MTPIPTNAVAERLIAGGRRPAVLGAVVVGSGDALGQALFDVLAHVSCGADGIDLTLPASLPPGDRLAVANQLAEASGVALYLRADAPMAAGDHTLILSAVAGRLRASVNVVFDVEIDQLGAAPDSSEVTAAWPLVADERALLVSTAGFNALSDAALMGIASAASTRGLTAVSTDRVRIVRRVVDTLAPLLPRAASGGVASCR